MTDSGAWDSIIGELGTEQQREAEAAMTEAACQCRAAGDRLAADLLEYAADSIRLGLPGLDATACFRAEDIGAVPDGGPGFARCAVCDAWLWIPPGGVPDPDERYVCTGEVHSDDELAAHGLLSGGDDA
jgi:hypothetical protein